MKKSLLLAPLIFLLFFCSTYQTAFAQFKLWGLTALGGSQNQGTVYKVNEDGTGYSYTSLVDISQGAYPQGSLVRASNGKLYGVAQGGDVDENNLYTGVIFEFDPLTSTYLKKITLNLAGGSNPTGNLTQAPNGKLYGMTHGGGANNAGVIFEFDPNSGVYAKKIDLDYATGWSPLRNSMMLAPNGKLYGMTNGGGANGLGVIFEFDPSSGSYSKKMDFERTTSGAMPFGDLIQATNGKLYGLTMMGGSANQGCLFEYNYIDGTFAKKIDFQISTNGGYPMGSLVQAANGKLYGSTNAGGINNNGVLFEFDPATDGLAVKAEFQAAVTGNESRGAMILSPNGKLYGINSNGGAANGGVLFEFDPSSGAFTKKSDFSFSTGIEPQSGLIVVPSAKAVQTITFNSLPAKTFGDTPFQLTATTTSGLDITYTSSDVSVATIAGKTVTILKAGSTVITASQAGNSSFNPSSKQQTLIVSKANQNITFNSLPSKTYGASPFDLTASSTSGLNITFTSSDPLVASISGRTVTILKAGTTTITASQSGNLNYNAATSVSRTLEILKSNQVITFNPLPLKTKADAPFYLTATSSSGLAISYTSSDPKIASVNGNLVAIHKEGSVIITASQVGSSNYNPAKNVSQTLKIDKKHHCDDSHDDDDDAIKVFPNPASEFVTVHLGHRHERSVVSIFQQDGVLKSSKEVHDKEVKFHVADYLNDTYIVKIVTGNSIQTIRFNKN